MLCAVCVRCGETARHGAALDRTCAFQAAAPAAFRTAPAGQAGRRRRDGSRHSRL
jgi:hypothetical protein